MNLSLLLVKENVSHINESKAFLQSFISGSIALNYLNDSANYNAYEELALLIEARKVDIDFPLYIITNITEDEMYFFCGDAEIQSRGQQSIGCILKDVYGVSHILYLDNPYSLVSINVEKARHLELDLDYSALQIHLSKLICENPFDIPECCIVLKPSDFIQHVNKHPLGYLRMMLVK